MLSIAIFPNMPAQKAGVLFRTTQNMQFRFESIGAPLFECGTAPSRGGSRNNGNCPSLKIQLLTGGHYGTRTFSPISLFKISESSLQWLIPLNHLRDDSGPQNREWRCDVDYVVFQSNAKRFKLFRESSVKWNPQVLDLYRPGAISAIHCFVFFSTADRQRSYTWHSECICMVLKHMSLFEGYSLNRRTPNPFSLFSSMLILARGSSGRRPIGGIRKTEYAGVGTCTGPYHTSISSGGRPVVRISLRTFCIVFIVDDGISCKYRAFHPSVGFHSLRRIREK
jgi:hypothetical protein